MPKIFISYSREDSKHAAGRLALALSAYVRPGSIYFDVEGRRGVDFVKLYEARAAEADVVLAVIGANWNPERRLDSADSHVRREILAAHANGVSVLPVLLDQATIPKPQDLPDVLHFLCKVGAERLTHETFDGDVKRLLRTVRELAETKSQLPTLSAALQERLDEELERTRQIHRRRDIARLPESVRLVAEHALQSELAAIESQYRARSAADSASGAVRRGRQKEVGTHDFQTSREDGTPLWSAGDGDFHNKNGFCEYKSSTTDGGKVHYRGQFKNNQQSGFGVRDYTPADGAPSSRFEGESLDGKRNGFGSATQGGDCWVGEFRDGKMNGPGVYRWASGDRFEGEFRTGEFHGLGVIWSEDGTIKKVGRWENGEHRAL